VYDKLTEKKRGNMSYNDVIIMLLGEDKKRGNMSYKDVILKLQEEDKKNENENDN